MGLSGTAARWYCETDPDHHAPETQGESVKPGPKPRILTEQELEAASRMAGYGLTNTAVAHCLGIAPRTFQDMMTRFPEIGARLEKGRAQAEQMVANALFTKAVAGDLGAICWWEKTRAGRHERMEIVMTDEQREAQIQELLHRGEQRLKLA